MRRVRGRGSWIRWQHAPKWTVGLAGLAFVVQLVSEALGNGLLGNLGWAPPSALAAASMILQLVVSRTTGSEPVEEPPTPPNVPLPPRADLLGRDSAIDAVADTLRRHRVVLVHGVAGMGVSSVAIEAARRVVPDEASQDYVNLLGHNQRRPDNARRVAIRVLTALGLDPGLVPNVEAAGRKARDELQRGGRMLVLDNVISAEQVAWLVAPVPDAYLVVAGGFDLSTLHLPAVPVAPLDVGPALELTARQDPGDHRGSSVRDRIEADPRGARELAEKYLGRARAAIAVGERLARSPRISLRDLLEDFGDREPSTMASYVRKLLLKGASDGARTLLASLAQVPVSVLSEAAVAALIDEDRSRTAHLLDELVGQRVVERLRPARYLVLEEARSLGRTAGRPARGGPARLIKHYGRWATRHAAVLSSGAPPSDVARACDWFRAEDSACAQLLGMTDPPRRAASHLWSVADSLEVWFTLENRPSDRQDVAQAMAGAAERLGDRGALLTGHLRLVAICRTLGDLTGADHHLVEAQRLVGDAADRRRGGAWFHTNRGLLHLTHGQFDQALSEIQRSSKLRPRDDEVGRAVDLTNLGAALLRQGQPDSAYARLNEALAVAERSGDVVGQAHAQELLGVVALRDHNERRARELWAEAEQLYDQRGVEVGQARCLANIASVLLALDRDHAAAEAMLCRSLELRGSQDTGVGAALTHLRLAQLAGRSSQLARVREHRRQGLAALRGWDQQISEPAEVAEVRRQLNALTD